MYIYTPMIYDTHMYIYIHLSAPFSITRNTQEAQVLSWARTCKVSIEVSSFLSLSVSYT